MFPSLRRGCDRRDIDRRESPVLGRDCKNNDDVQHEDLHVSAFDRFNLGREYKSSAAWPVLLSRSCLGQRLETLRSSCDYDSVLSYRLDMFLEFRMCGYRFDCGGLEFSVGNDYSWFLHKSIGKDSKYMAIFDRIPRDTS